MLLFMLSASRTHYLWTCVQTDDLPGVHHALVMFLESKMFECEEFIRECDPDMCVLPLFSLTSY